jgi:AcrR family transcriptional regulator
MHESFTSLPSAAQKLVLATEKLVAERGVEGTSVREILRRANQKNNSAIYLYFGNREKLIKQTFDIRQAELEAERTRRVEMSGTVPDDTLALLKMLLEPVLTCFEREARLVFAQFILHLILHDTNSPVFSDMDRPPTTGRIMRALRSSCPDLPDDMFRFRIIMAVTQFLQAIVYRDGAGFAGSPPAEGPFWHDVLKSLAAALKSPLDGQAVDTRI